MVGELCYIGSTKDIRKRIWKHKSDCYNKNERVYNIRLYKTIREVYETNWDNVKWSVVDCYYNVDKDFRKTIEQYYIDFFKSELNMVGVVFDYKQYQKQYRNKNREKLLEKQKQYRIENKEKKLERDRQYYNENKEQVLEYQKQYRIENKQKIKERARQYYLKNRKKRLEKITCICGSTYTKDYKKKHEKTKKHQNYLLTIVK